MTHIFVVDDAFNIRELIRMYLEKEGFKVTAFSNGEHVFEEIHRLKPDVIVLDIMMDGISGLDLCKKIRAIYDLPIIFVSARDEEIDRIIGLEIGADDYLAKPFSPRELVIRIKNILRRMQVASTESNQVQVANLSLSPKQRSVYVDQNELKLTAKEYEVLELLARNLRMPFTRDQLMDKVWGFNEGAECRLVDDVIKRLRKKMKDAQAVAVITTVWGYGYRLDD